MEDRIYIVIMNLFIYGILLILQILTPKITRKNIYFGVRIPEEEIYNLELKNIYKIYIIENILASIPAIALLSYWTYKVSNPTIVVLTVFIYIGVLFFVYLHANYKTRKLKREKNWIKPKDEVVIDLKFSKDKINAGNVSAWWYLIPLGIALLSLIIGLILFPTLPDKLPSHWDLQGNLDGYMDKTTFIWFMLLTELGMTALFFFVHKVIGWSKQEISSENPEESVKRNIIFRRVWSMFCLANAIIINFLFLLISFYSFEIIGISMKGIIILLIIYSVLVILGSIIISIKVGQGGSRLKFNKGYEERSRDDDEFWKLGNTIYYNPEDPALFIEKRFGVGWTVNVGRPFGMFFMILPFIIIILTLIFVS